MRLSAMARKRTLRPAHPPSGLADHETARPVRCRSIKRRHGDCGLRGRARAPITTVSVATIKTAVTHFSYLRIRWEPGCSTMNSASAADRDPPRPPATATPAACAETVELGGGDPRRVVEADQQAAPAPADRPNARSLQRVGDRYRELCASRPVPGRRCPRISPASGPRWGRRRPARCRPDARRPARQALSARLRRPWTDLQGSDAGGSCRHQWSADLLSRQAQRRIGCRVVAAAGARRHASGASASRPGVARWKRRMHQLKVR